MSEQGKADDDGAEYQVVKERPHAIVEEPLVLPEEVQSLLDDDVGKEYVIKRGENDDDDDHISQLDEDVEF